MIIMSAYIIISIIIIDEVPTIITTYGYYIVHVNEASKEGGKN